MPQTPDIPPIDPRVLFAAERTLLAWIRTGLALMGFGFVAARFGLFLREIMAAQHKAPAPSNGVSFWLGTGLVLLGGVVQGIAVQQHLQTLRRLKRGENVFPPTFSPGVVVALLLTILGIVMAASLLQTRY